MLQNRATRKLRVRYEILGLGACDQLGWFGLNEEIVSLRNVEFVIHQPAEETLLNFCCYQTALQCAKV